MKMDITEIIDTLKLAQSETYNARIQKVIDALKTLLKERDLTMATKGWTSTQIHLRWSDGSLTSYEIDAYVNPAYPGLAIHREAKGSKNEFWPGNRWVVTHVSSGMKCNSTNLTSIRKAAKFVTDCLSDFDWTRSNDEVQRDPAIKDVIRRIKGWQE